MNKTRGTWETCKSSGNLQYWEWIRPLWAHVVVSDAMTGDQWVLTHYFFGKGTENYDQNKQFLLLLSRTFALDINDCIPQIFFTLTLVHLMAWCHQATCYYQHQYWWKSPMPYGNTIPWETMLHCNIASHWLGAYTKWSLKHNEKCSVLILRSSSAVEWTVGLPVML